MSITAIIVAAGRGSRAGAGGPKQYRHLNGIAILARTSEVFLSHQAVTHVRVIIHKDDRALYDEAMHAHLSHPKLLPPVFGGAERQDSVRLGLESLSDAPPAYTLIHDAARPFIDHHTIDNVIEALKSHQGAIAALPVFDTIKGASSNSTSSPTDKLPLIDRTVSRDGLWRAQTPQGFHYQTILQAHRNVKGQKLTDDAAVCEANNISVALVPGSPDNMKITQAEDFGMAEILLQRHNDLSLQTHKKDPSMWEFRTGQGFDVHAFEPGNEAILCGVAIPHTAKLNGHSDADVGMHALTDAILGAIGEGDIGDHFPPSEPKWRGVASQIFLKKACELVAQKSGHLVNCDITLMCEAPKIGPHKEAMRDRLGEIINIDRQNISVKATTTEKLGFTGRSEGIAALAVATIKLPANS